MHCIPGLIMCLLYRGEWGIHCQYLSTRLFVYNQACWVIRYFAEMKFKNDQNLRNAVDLVRCALCRDRELPVKVEAAIALQMLISEQERGQWL